MSDDQSPTPIFDLGQALAKKMDDKQTTITLEASREGLDKVVGIEVENAHEGPKLSWSVAAWWKNKFKKDDGHSGGIKGKISFD